MYDEDFLALMKQDLEENGGEEDNPTEGPSEPDTPTDNPPTDENPTDGEGDSPNEPTTQKDNSDQEPSLEEKYAQMEKLYLDSKSFNGRLTTELGNLRAKLAEFTQIKAAEVPEIELSEDELEKMKDTLYENPVKAISNVLSRVQQVKAKREMEADQVAQEYFNTNKSILESYVPDFETKIDSICESLKADKLSDADIQAFKQNPLGVFSVDTLINLAKRSSLEAEVKALREENARLKDPNRKVTSFMEKSSSKVPPLKAGGSTKPPSDPFAGITDEQLESMSDAELEKLEYKLISKAGGI